MSSESPSWWRRWWRPRKAKAKRLKPTERIAKTVPLLRVVLVAMTTGVLFVSMTPPQLLTPVPFVEGQIFPYDIRAHRTVRYLSVLETERRQQEVAASVPKVYSRDPSVSAYLQAVIRDLFDAAASLRTMPVPIAEKVRRLRQKITVGVPDSVLETLLKAPPTTLKFMQTIFLRLASEEWRRGIKPLSEERTAAVQRVRSQIDQLPLTSKYRLALKQLTDVILQPNMAFDPKETEQVREKARRAVAPIWRTIRVSETIARKGELVTPVHLEKLRALGYNFSALVGVLLLALILTVGAILFLRTIVPEVYANEHFLTLLTITWLPFLLMVRFLSHLTGGELSFPLVATASMITAVMLTPIISVFASGVTALVVTLSTAIDWQTGIASELRLFLVIGITGAIAAFLCIELRNRAQIVRSGVLLGVSALILQLLVGVITGEALMISGNELKRVFVWSVLTGVMPPALTLVGVSILERPFNITTVFTLMELSSPHAPILRDLAEKAPGTFQSSLMVARLAQEAARRIGANELLTWTGALYHDIGKLSRPAYFVENQPPGASNPHDHMSPQMSAKVLALHVRQGEEIARQHRLPEPIIDIIREHHGTSPMTYFLAKAKERGEFFNEIDYRYEGPKPSRKESAIVMLADSVEATVRAINDLNPEKIEQIVGEVIAAKIADGQLNESPLGFRDLQEIQKAFTDTLKSIYHQRIEYPKVEAEKHVNNSHRPHNSASERQQKTSKTSKRTNTPTAASG